MYSKLRYWIPLAVTITLLCGLIYGVGQQILRTTANDPQIQMAEDIAASLSHGEEVDLPKPVDISNSLAPFVITYDKDGKVVMSTGKLNGKDPVLPQGVLNATSYASQNRLTWQPAEHVRVAAIVSKYQGMDAGYVLVGRNLREVEKREDKLFLIVALGWGVTMIASLLATLLVLPIHQRK